MEASGPAPVRRRLTFAAFVFPAIFAVGPSLPPPSGPREPVVEETKVQPPDEPCDDAHETDATFPPVGA